MTYPIKDECISHTLSTTKMAEDLTPGGERVYRYVLSRILFFCPREGAVHRLDYPIALSVRILVSPMHSLGVAFAFPLDIFTVLRSPSVPSNILQAPYARQYDHFPFSLLACTGVFQERHGFLPETLSTILDPN